MSHASRHENSLNNGKQIRFLETPGFSKILKSNSEEKNRLTTDFINERLNRTDVFGLVELIGIATEAKIENKPEANQILNTISDYLTSTDEPIFKSLAGKKDIGGSGKNVACLYKTVEAIVTLKGQMSIEKKKEIFGGTNNSISIFIDHICKQAKENISEEEALFTLILANEYGQNDMKNILKVFKDDIKKKELENKIELFGKEIDHKLILIEAVNSIKDKLICGDKKEKD